MDDYLFLFGMIIFTQVIQILVLAYIASCLKGAVIIPEPDDGEPKILEEEDKTILFAIGDNNVQS